ncbi:DNA-binding protein [Gluconacetobacter takamatsuzukensis]|uniref:DNA-binding protein n=1 Tax=Gluconacetobacter takamatsuzukensis TaxID=1286190 RepID=A0A7W4KBP9_9PROT|nr:DNA-binding protein [Gluconacetobacter takamatsuzukensis]MBB2203973.1 DNA-binding protein [Gluconacetobacter takamatsuzukensis]
MSGLTPPDGANDGLATVHVFPLRRVLPLGDAAVYLGIPARRLRMLGLLHAGPRPAARNGRTLTYRVEDLDRYVTQLYGRARISAAEEARQRQEWRARIAAPAVRDARGRPPRMIDPCMQALTLDVLVSSGGPLGLKLLFASGLGLIFLSHTPVMWRLYAML